MEDIELPQSDRVRMRSFMTGCKMMQRQEFYQDVLQVMSPQLRGEMAMRQCGDWIAKVRFFCCDDPAERERFTMAVACVLKRACFAGMEPIFKPGDAANRLYIVQGGVVGYQGATLRAGDNLGEEMLMTQARRTLLATAMTFVDMQCLSCDQLYQIFEDGDGDFAETEKLVHKTTLRMALRKHFRTLINIVKANGVFSADAQQRDKKVMRQWKEDMRRKACGVGITHTFLWALRFGRTTPICAHDSTCLSRIPSPKQREIVRLLCRSVSAFPPFIERRPSSRGPTGPNSAGRVGTSRAQIRPVGFGSRPLCCARPHGVATRVYSIDDPRGPTDRAVPRVGVVFAAQAATGGTISIKDIIREKTTRPAKASLNSVTALLKDALRELGSLKSEVKDLHDDVNSENFRVVPYNDRSPSRRRTRLDARRSATPIAEGSARKKAPAIAVDC